MTLGQQIRMPLLAVTCVGVLLALVKLTVDPNAVRHTVTPFAFPPDVPLPEGQLLQSKPLADTVTRESIQQNAVIASRHYRYRYKSIPLDIEMRYVVATFGNVEDFIKYNTAIQLSPGQMFQTLRQQEGVGFYSMFVHQNRAYLSACINPRGGTTITTGQFIRNRHTYDLRWSRLLPWLLGRESLRDRRCLWAHLSTPVNDANSKSAYSVLEKAWFSWYEWWSPRFPKH